MEEKRCGWIDAVKGIAILGVVLVHSMSGMELPSVLEKISQTGDKGVQIFFIVAAYLAYGSYGKNLNKGKSVAYWWKNRIIRIAPAYYIAIITSMLFLGGSTQWIGVVEKISAANMIAHISFLHGLSPYYINSILGVEWYLADYVILMLLIPVLYKVINNFSKSVAFLVLSSIGSYFFILMSRNWSIISDTQVWDIYIGSFGFLAQLPVMAMGIVLYFLINDNRIWERCTDKKILSYALLAGSVYGIVILMAGVSFKGLTIQVVYGGILFVFILSQAIYGCPLIDNCFWRTLGSHSYLIYLFHYFFIMTFNHFWGRIAGSSIKAWGIRFVFVWAVSWIMIFLEDRIKKMIRSSRTGFARRF